MYPILDIESVISHATNLYQLLDAALRTGLASESDHSIHGVGDENLNLLKMVMACALAVEETGNSELGNRLLKSVWDFADTTLHSTSIEVKDLRLLILIVSYSRVCFSLENTDQHPSSLHTTS